MRMLCFAATLISGFAAFAFWWLVDVIVSRRTAPDAVMHNDITLREHAGFDRCRSSLLSQPLFSRRLCACWVQYPNEI